MKRILFTTVSLLLTFPSWSAPSLLPFQGHLTDAAGVPVADGAKIVQFKLYDAPVSGTAVWAGEVHKLSVNGGLVNTILGTKAAFPATYGTGAAEKPMFSEPLYLEITVDANTDDQINASDPPLLPRQILLPANFAHQAGRALEADLAVKAIDAETAQNAVHLEGVDLLDATGRLVPGAFAPTSIATTSLMADNKISNEHLAPNSVHTAELSPRSVSIDKLGGMREPPSPNASKGEVAVSGVSGGDGVQTITGTAGETIGSVISVVTTGRPVRIQLAPAGSSGAWVDYVSTGLAGQQGVLKLFRNGGERSASYQLRMVPRGGNNVISAMPASISFIDFPPAGTISYTLQGSLAAAGGALRIVGCHLIAYEL
ncbi:MAG: hypothetical protein R3F19_17610 [Verrucomicrobiales bacterium]